MPKKRHYGVEYLRFALATAVVVFHYCYYGPLIGSVPAELKAGTWLALGPFAVYAFFIISGFVISMSADGKSWQEFLASRISRLLPALVACSTLTALALVLAQGWNGAMASIYLRSVAFFPILLGGTLIDDSYWSITFEMRFYALIAVLLAVSAFQRSAEILTALLVVAWALVMSDMFVGMTPYLLVPHGSLFVLGILLYRARSGALGPEWLVLLAINLVLAWQGAKVHLEVAYGAGGQLPSGLAIAGAVGLSFAGVAIAQRIEMSARAAWLAALLGGLSYPLYLLHQVIGYEVIRAVAAVSTPALGLAIAVCCAFGLAAAVHFQIERRYSRPLREAILRGFGAGAAQSADLNRSKLVVATEDTK